MQSESELDPALINGVKRTENPQNEPQQKMKMKRKHRKENSRKAKSIMQQITMQQPKKRGKQIWGIRLQITKITRHIS